MIKIICVYQLLFCIFVGFITFETKKISKILNNMSVYQFLLFMFIRFVIYLIKIQKIIKEYMFNNFYLPFLLDLKFINQNFQIYFKKKILPSVFKELWLNELN